MKRMNGESLNLIQLNIEKLKELFPNVVSDGKIDFDALRVLLGDEIDSSNEKYQFTWNGKTNSIKFAQTSSTATLIPCEYNSKNWNRTKNFYIEGDNEEVLKLLQKTYSKKIDIIYIDPPYNTGNDFIYKDNYLDNISNYFKTTHQESRANPDFAGRFHTNWLNMIYPRLMLAKNLLSENGIIFISIDDHEQENLKKICNEIFGELNFIAQIVWERAFSPVNLKKHFSESHDYILCYAKNIEELICNGLPRSSESDSRYSNPDNDPRGPWTSGDLSVGPAVQSRIYEIVTPGGRKVLPPNGYCWRLDKNTYQKYVDDNRIYFGTNENNVPRIKRFLSEVKQGMTPMTIWKFTEVGHSQEASQYLKKIFDNKSFFDYPKPVELLKRCVQLYSNKNSIILDFFSGSGTTAEAVMKLNSEDNGNRKFIMVQLPELCEEKSEAFKNGYKNICEIGEERIRRAGQKIYNELKEKYDNAGQLVNDYVNPDNLDLGFKVFKLDSTNIKPWDGSTKVDENTILNLEDTIKEDRTNLDVAYEIMLKYGIFNMPLKEVQINNKIMYSIGEGYRVICLDKDITLDDVVEIANLKPHCVVFKEQGFADDNEKINATYTLERMGIEDVKCI